MVSRLLLLAGSVAAKSSRRTTARTRRTLSRGLGDGELDGERGPSPRPATFRCLAGFRVALFLPLARTQTPLWRANGRIGRIVDPAWFHRVERAFWRLAAHVRNTGQIGCFCLEEPPPKRLSVNNLQYQPIAL